MQQLAVHLRTSRVLCVRSCSGCGLSYAHQTHTHANKTHAGHIRRTILRWISPGKSVRPNHMNARIIVCEKYDYVALAAARRVFAYNSNLYRRWQITKAQAQIREQPAICGHTRRTKETKSLAIISIWSRTACIPSTVQSTHNCTNQYKWRAFTEGNRINIYACLCARRPHGVGRIIANTPKPPFKCPTYCSTAICAFHCVGLP